MKTGLLTLLTLLLAVHTQAGSATWNTNPPQSLWSVSSDWTPNTVPNGPSDVATFGTSSKTNITNAGLSLSQMIFNPGASSYNITPTPFATFTVSGPGITNNSGALQVFTIGPGNTQKHTEISFVNSASAGVSTQFINQPSGNIQVLGGLVSFYDTATAGTANFVNNPKTTTNGGGGLVYFDGSSTAGSSTFLNSASVEFFGSSSGGSAHVTNEGSNGAVNTAAGFTVFSGNADAGNGTYIENDGVAGANGGFLEFSGTSSAGSATLIANGGFGGGSSISFDNGSPSGGSARVELFVNNAILDITFTNSPGTTIGSLEGSGTAYVGANTLTVGSNNLSTIFSGLLTDLRQFGGSGGGIAKIGTGTFTLSGANTYPGGTVVSAGTLVVSNTTGSGTGTGAVQVNGGSLGGSGTIAGPVTVGTGAFVAPAAGTIRKATLTIQSALNFNTGSTYTYTARAKGRQAQTDKVVANGVAISGASFSFQAQVQGALRAGTVLTVISNTSASPISGTFANLPDGGILTVNGNNFQANYEGGDGNDLTLTVVP